MITTYELYSESIGDWPLVCYYSLSWLVLFFVTDVFQKQSSEKLSSKDDKSVSTNGESKD